MSEGSNRKKRATPRHRLWMDSSIEGLSLIRAVYQGQRFSPHAHETFVLAANLGGPAAFDFRRDDSVLEAGSLGVIPPGRTHGGHGVDDEPWVHVAAHASGSFLTDLLREVSGRDSVSPRFQSPMVRDPVLATAFCRAHGACLFGDSLEGESAMIEVLGELLSRHSTPRPPRAPDRHGVRGVRRVKDFIESRLSQRLSLASLAEIGGYSKYHFLRLFKRETGLTPHAYLVNRRIDRAQDLLRRGVPIAEVALEVGFCDQAHLTGSFRRQVGVTPGEFVRGARSVVPA